MRTSEPSSAVDPSVRVVGRLAVPKDSDAIERLFRSAISRPADDQWLAAVVALADDTVVGTAVATVSAEGAVSAAVAVDRAWQGRGIPTFLARLLGDELVRRGVNEVVAPQRQIAAATP
ncbi:MAG TPA: GNAT family N-acetyltransferase [Acidimicrobiales bacterium]|jgi:GNAT superfamily N-acetyltransferase|nr:GNAT family N-acetyltransferase [Acidimicrobiales bacterium]